MSDFLTRLVQRQIGTLATIQPRTRSMFDPAMKQLDQPTPDLPVIDRVASSDEPRPPAETPRHSIASMHIISEKDMFLINKYNRLFPVKLDPSQYQGKINNFVIDSKGRIYIASDILVRYDPYKEEVKNYSVDAATLSKASLSLGCDKNDNIWIGTDGSGFYKLLFGDVVAEQINAIILVENNLSCQGGQNGSIKVSVSGGLRPYTYKWNISGATGTIASGLAAGNYEVTVTDKNQKHYRSQSPNT